MSNFPIQGNVNLGFVYIPQNVPRQRRGLSVAESEQAVRDACLAHALGSDSVRVINPNSSRTTNVVIGAGGNNPIYVNNVGTKPTPGIRVVTPTVTHQRCGVRGCTRNHAVHTCRRCGAHNRHFTSDCDVYCGLPGCHKVHRIHTCQICNLNGHRTANCPNVVTPPVAYIGGKIAGFGLHYKR